MAGLLDLPDFNSAAGQGLLAASLSLMGAQKMPGQKGAFGSALANAGRTYMDTRNQAGEQLQAQEYKRLQLDALKRKMEQEKQQAQEQERIRGLMAGAMGHTGPAASSSVLGAAMPGDDRAATLPEIDYQSLIRQGVPFELVKQLADSRNLGRDKVARTADIEGPNGSKMVQGYDDYGQPVGQGAPGYVAPQLIDTGDRKTFAKPMTGQSFAMGMSPSNQIAIRGQNMTDSRARDLNAISQQANGIKLGEKEQASNLAKAGQVASFDVMLGSLDRLGKHPGLARSVGLTGAFPTMPGSESANFKAELDTFQSQAFLPMVSQLKGMGALSDAEGKKLTAAVGALNPAMGEQAFRASIKRITEDMDAARSRLTSANSGGAGGSWDKPKTKTVVKTGMYGGRKVNQYSDGSTDYAD